MSLPLYINTGAFPGMTEAVETVEGQVWYGNIHQQYVDQMIVDGAARDAGNTSNTTMLRPGLLLGQKTATPNKVQQWDPTATDGTERIWGVCLGCYHMQLDNSDRDLWVAGLKFGHVLDTGIIIPGETDPGMVGKDLEYAAAAGLLEAGIRPRKHYSVGLTTVKPVPDDATLVADDSGKHITDYGATGAVAITLPAPKLGMQMLFSTVTNNTTTISTATADTLIADGDAAADSVALEQGETALLKVVQTGASTYQWQVIYTMGGAIATA